MIETNAWGKTEEERLSESGHCWYVPGSTCMYVLLPVQIAFFLATVF